MDGLPEQLTALRTELESGMIGFEDAIAKYHLLTKNLYQRAWWRKHRDGLIKDHCEQCGATDGAMVLQHFEHPKTLAQRRDLVYKRLRRRGWTWQRFVADPQLQTTIVVSLIADKLYYLVEAETNTFCTKCAYLWNKKGLRLCPRCHLHYHRHEFQCCLSCHNANSDPPPGAYDSFGWPLDDHGNSLGPTRGRVPITNSEMTSPQVAP